MMKSKGQMGDPVVLRLGPLWHDLWNAEWQADASFEFGMIGIARAVRRATHKRGMRPRSMPFSQVTTQERRRWLRFRQALSKEDQEACDRMCAYAAQQPQAEVQLGRL
ncbi:MAG TPA: hypothetical protein VLK82_20405 [Candidatus Tectomicrobia bacterium]|nr:hypothetical protein [Candidatus Tectomicrobia bacterium]